MSSRTCPDWPHLMEVAPELQFKHFTVREAELPVAALIMVDPAALDTVSMCCDLAHHVFNPDHTERQVGAALRASHWFDLREWVRRPRGQTAA